MPARKKRAIEHVPAFNKLTRADKQAILNALDSADEIRKGHRQLDSDYFSNINKVITVHEFRCVDNSTYSLPYADPNLLLQILLEQCPLLRERYRLAVRAHGTHWHVVMGFDEFCPGDKLSFDSSNKIMCLYFSFKELDAASNGNLWLCPLVARATSIHIVDGRWSHMVARFLHRMFLGPHGFHTVGIPIDEDTLIFCELKIYMSDGDGLKQAFGWNGARSIRPSLTYSNVLMKDSELVGVHVPVEFVEITCSDHRQLQKMSTREYHDTFDLIAAAHERYNAGLLTKGLLDQLHKAYGFHYIPNGLCYDLILRSSAATNVCKAKRVDWMHTLLQDGAFTHEATLMTNSTDRWNAEDLRIYLKQDWQFPKSNVHKGARLWRVFSEHRLHNGQVDKVRASASELLGLVTLLRHFFAINVRRARDPTLDENWKSFQFCCDVIELLMECKHGLRSPRASAQLLRERIDKFLQQHQSVYGKAHIKPKHNWLYSIADQLEMDDCVYDMFTIERLHLLVKAHASRTKRSDHIERFSLAGVLNQQINTLGTLKGHCCFNDEPVRVRGFGDKLFADSMTVHNLTYSAGDIVFRRNQAGKLLACVFDSGSFYGLLEMYRKVADATSKDAIWDYNTNDLEFVAVQELSLALSGALKEKKKGPENYIAKPYSKAI